MPKTVVVPLAPGHIEQSGQQIDMAKAIAGDDAKIVLVSVIEAIPAIAIEENPDDYYEKLKVAANADLVRVAQDNRISPDIEIRVGYPPTEILAIATEKSAYAIVIASHRPGLEHYLLGSTAARIVEHANCSVLVLR